MRLLVVSDSHGDEGALLRALEAQPTARVVIHLGDGAREMAAVAEGCPERTVYGVRGNCDWTSDAAGLVYARDETVGGKRIFFTHGHLYGVKSDLLRVTCAARERGADILLYGHTHVPFTVYDDGLYILNPGSLAGGAYGIVDITAAGIVPSLLRLRR